MATDNDVFISYAHIDNQPLVEGQRGWISELHRILKIRLAQLTGEAPQIWMDERGLHGNDRFADELDQSCPASAVILSVFSPRYLKSDWCQRELQNFLGDPPFELQSRLGNRSRIFKVVKTPVPLEEEPEATQALLGYEFYDVDAATGRPVEFQGAAEDRYLARLNDLAQDLCDTLTLPREAREQDPGGAAAAAPAAPAGSRGTVYLATTTSDLTQQRDEVRRDLESRGYGVLPDAPLPLVGAECRAAVAELQGRASLSIHPLGAYYGAIPEGSEQSLAQLQYELAAERARGGGLTQVIWMPAGATPAEARQKEFTEELVARLNDALEVDLVTTGLESLKTLVLTRLERPASENPEPAAEAGPARVYLVYDPADLETVEPLANRLYDEGLEVVLSLLEGDDAELRQLHQDNLLEADAALIVYDRAPAVWVETKVRELRKSQGYEGARPKRARAVLVTGEESPHKRLYRSHELLVIKHFGAGEPADLEAFLEPLRGGSTGP